MTPVYVPATMPMVSMPGGTPADSVAAPVADLAPAVVEVPPVAGCMPFAHFYGMAGHMLNSSLLNPGNPLSITFAKSKIASAIPVPLQSQFMFDSEGTLRTALNSSFAYQDYGSVDASFNGGNCFSSTQPFEMQNTVGFNITPNENWLINLTSVMMKSGENAHALGSAELTYQRPSSYYPVTANLKFNPMMEGVWASGSVGYGSLTFGGKYGLGGLNDIGAMGRELCLAATLNGALCASYSFYQADPNFPAEMGPTTWGFGKLFCLLPLPNESGAFMTQIEKRPKELPVCEVGVLSSLFNGAVATKAVARLETQKLFSENKDNAAVLRLSIGKQLNGAEVTSSLDTIAGQLFGCCNLRCEKGKIIPEFGISFDINMQ